MCSEMIHEGANLGREMLAMRVHGMDRNRSLVTIGEEALESPASQFLGNDTGRHERDAESLE